MPVYYIRINTDSKLVSVRKAKWFDNFIEYWFAEPFFMIKSSFNDFASMDWVQLEKKLDYYAHYFEDKYDPKYI